MKTQLSRRQRQRQATIEEIKSIAQQQIAENGASNLSLGAIAREMGMTPPALYRYFENRNGLLTALMIDAYDAMGQALENALIDKTGCEHTEQFLGLLDAYRQWAQAQPEAYALMVITSTETTQMSEEQHQKFEQAVLRSMGTMVQVLNAAYADNRLIIPAAYSAPPPSTQQALLWMRVVLQDETIPLGILALALTTWLRVDGLVWQELHGHLPKALFGEGDFFMMESRVFAESLGFKNSAERIDDHH